MRADDGRRRGPVDAVTQRRIRGKLVRNLRCLNGQSAIDVRVDLEVHLAVHLGEQHGLVDDLSRCTDINEREQAADVDTADAYAPVRGSVVDARGGRRAVDADAGEALIEPPYAGAAISAAGAPSWCDRNPNFSMRYLT